MFYDVILEQVKNWKGYSVVQNISFIEQYRFELCCICVSFNSTTIKDRSINFMRMQQNMETIDITKITMSIFVEYELFDQSATYTYNRSKG